MASPSLSASPSVRPLPRQLISIVGGEGGRIWAHLGRGGRDGVNSRGWRGARARIWVEGGGTGYGRLIVTSGKEASPEPLSGFPC
eukprot:7808858-Pyramimonas_sp.AAC.1